MNNINENQCNKEPNYRDLLSTPWYFGAYLNMARHNLFLLINHLTDKFSYLNFSKLKEDGDINHQHILACIFDPGKTQYETERFKIYKYLVKRHYLPFIKVFHAENGYNIDTNPIVNYNGLHECLNNIFKLINKLRNSYSHYLAIDQNGHKIDIREKEVDISVKQTMTALFENAEHESKNRFSNFEDPNFHHLKQYLLFDKGTNNLTEQGFYFFICLFIERKYAYKFLKKLKGFKNETLPSYKATLVNFTAYSPKIADVRLDSQDNRNELLLDILNELHKCPKELYYHLNDEDKKKFVPLLDEDSKENILNNQNYHSIPDEDLDQLLEGINAKIRHTDRFPYLALRYIEEYNLLPNIRFQIAVGKLNIRTYKKVINQVTIDRVIQKPIRKFGKLYDFIGKEQQILARIKSKTDQDTVQDDMYFTQYAPHYNLEANKIAFYYSDKDKEIAQNAWDEKIPTGFFSVNDLPKLLLLALLDKSKTRIEIAKYLGQNTKTLLNKIVLDKIKQQLNLKPERITKRSSNVKLLLAKNRPVAYLNNTLENQLLSKWKIRSRQDLVQLSKVELNKKTNNSKIQLEYAKQISYHYLISERMNQLQQHLPKGIMASELPEEVKKYLLNIDEPNNEKQIHQKIKAIKEDIKLKLKQLKNECNKPITEQKLKVGTIATYIARDIIDMVIDKDLKGKLTSPYYNVLQNRIAYFSISKASIIALCEEMSLFDTTKGHAFLEKILIENSRGILDFYENYLNAKNNWIERYLFKRGKDGGYQLPHAVHLLNKIPYSIKKLKDDIANRNFDNWLENKKKMPINFPNSLFDNTLNTLLQVKLKSEKISYNNTDKFSVLLAKMLNNDRQTYYDYLRIYNTSKEPTEISINGLDSKTLKGKYGKYVEANEKKIRHLLTQDRILLMLCNNIIASLSNMSLETNAFLKLQDCEPNNEQSPLNKQWSFRHHIKQQNIDFVIIGKDTPQQITAINHYKQLPTEEERNIYTGQKGYAWTIKDFGRFKRIVYDRRIPNMIEEFVASDSNMAKEISFEFIDYQLQEYDKYREQIFQKTFELEKYLAENDFVVIKEKKKSEYKEVEFEVYIEYLKEKCLLDASEAEIIKGIRNKLSHSEFPLNTIGLSKITKEELAAFDAKRLEKGAIKELNISICQKVYHYYENICKRIVPTE